jgi:pimeloyl-ACP methyl ester carboxylesterase
MPSRGRFFKHDDFEFSLELLLGTAYYRAADVGEVLATAARVKDGDFESWCREWEETANRTAAAAESTAQAGHPVSAREAYLRASTYWFQVAFYAMGTSDGASKFEACWRAHRRCFERAAALFEPPVEKVEIPYEDTTLEGWLFRVDDSGRRRPLLLLNNGSDGTATDMYVQGAASGIDRGYNCLTFDGPGQNHALHEQGLYFRPDWESVVSPVVDYALTRDDVDLDRIAILGVSQGGYWVPRAVAFEPRIAAAIADPGVVDVSRAMTDHLPASMRKLLDAGEKDKFDRQIARVERFSKSLRFTMKFRSFPYGTDSPFEMFTRARDYRLQPEVIRQIRCPTLITDPEDEQFWPGQSRELYDALESPKELLHFSAAEGAESHCEPKATGLRAQRIFDWLDATLA